MTTHKVEPPKKLVCTKCGKEKTTIRNFYQSHSQIYEYNRIPVCKDCILERYEVLKQKYKDEIKAVYHICMNFDIYFNRDLITSCYSQMANDGIDNLLKTYFSKVNSLKQYKELTSLDSDSFEEDVTQQVVVEVESGSKKAEEAKSTEQEFVVTSEMIGRWGRNVTSEEDYFFLETTYNEFTSVYDARTPAQKLIFRQIAKSLLQGEKALKEGNISGFEKMNNLVSKLMGDNNIKPIQEANLAEDDSQGWGVWVNRVETERPVGEACEQFKDVDKISSYITKWFTKQMQRVFDLSDNIGGEENDANED